MAEPRRLVVGFGVNGRECGWAATVDLIRYDLKRRTGEWESTYVGKHGTVQQLILAADHEEATALRDVLNFSPHREAAPVVERLGLPSPKVGLVRRVLAIAWHCNGEVASLDLPSLVWRIVDAPPEASHELRAAIDVIDRAVGGSTGAPPAFDVTRFPFSAVVFDLDQTLVDSSAVPSPDAKRRWAETGDDDVISAFEARGPIAPHELPGLLNELGIPVGIATRSPRRYAERVLNTFGLGVDVVQAGSSDKAASVRTCAEQLGVDPTAMVVVGDDESDILAARAVGASSLGAAWSGSRSWPDRMQPDITVAEPGLLIEQADWWRLTYLAEQHDLGYTPVVHAGSWITYGGLQTYALGRYFPTRSRRHGEHLSQAILRCKETIEPEPSIARAVGLLAARVASFAEIDLVTSVPAPNGRPDRFVRYRAIASAALEAADATVLQELRNVGSLKNVGSHQARRDANQGRWAADPAVRGRSVLVIDDVITSGSTLEACAYALRAAGAAEVSCLAFAGTQD